jgi:hypothetical protein
VFGKPHHYIGETVCPFFHAQPSCKTIGECPLSAHFHGLFGCEQCEFRLFAGNALEIQPETKPFPDAWIPPEADLDNVVASRIGVLEVPFKPRDLRKDVSMNQEPIFRVALAEDDCNLRRARHERDAAWDFG